MTDIATITPELQGTALHGTLEPEGALAPPLDGALAPQRMRALERANAVRLARAELKRDIAHGRVSAADVILELPWEAMNWSVGELLMSQRRWGSNRTRKLLSGLQISENRHLGKLTERQRRVLVAQLERPGARELQLV